MGETVLTLYQLEWCPSCHTVRQLLTELGLTYLTVNVPLKAEERAQVTAVSGQSTVPVLQDGERVLTDAAAIVEYLRETYPEPADSGAQRERGSWLIARRLSISPQAALTRIRQLLQEEGFAVVSETPGDAIDERLPSGYVVLDVLEPEAAAQALTADVSAPGAVLIALTIAPAGGGGSIVAAADPVAQVWLFADPSLRKTQALVKRRLLTIVGSP